MGEPIGTECGPILQWPDGNRPFGGVFHNCTNVRLFSSKVFRVFKYSFRFLELEKEISEREQFLNEMTSIGQGQKYNAIIKGLI